MSRRGPHNALLVGVVEAAPRRAPRKARKTRNSGGSIRIPKPQGITLVGLTDRGAVLRRVKALPPLDRAQARTLAVHAYDLGYFGIQVTLSRNPRLGLDEEAVSAKALAALQALQDRTAEGSRVHVVARDGIYHLRRMVHKRRGCAEHFHLFPQDARRLLGPWLGHRYSAGTGVACWEWSRALSLSGRDADEHEADLRKALALVGLDKPAVERLAGLPETRIGTLYGRVRGLLG
ncbi:MAG: hypothetical protein M5U26_19665 [Planctomycetota bacterium]|nr:hypothetical protein [Planctomycetota bacterium]